MTANIINLANNNIDLNSLFHMNISFNYNFDLLKNAMELLINSQKSQGMKMMELEDKVNKRDRKIEEMERTIISLKRIISEKPHTNVSSNHPKNDSNHDEKNNLDNNSSHNKQNDGKNTQESNNNDNSNYNNNSYENKDQTNLKDSDKNQTEDKRNFYSVNNDNTAKNVVYNINYGNQDEKTIIFNKDESKNREFIYERSGKNDDDNYYSTEDREKQMLDDITFLKIKIMNFENQFNNIFFINDEVKEIKYRIKEYDQINDSNKHYINELLNKSNENQSKFSQIDKNIEDINIKLLDFNIFDIFKNKASSDGKTDVGDTIILIQALEKKIFKKLELVDDKNKKIEDESYKIKNEMLHLKNGNENHSKSIENLKIMDNDLIKKSDELHKNMNQNEQNMIKLITEKYDELNDLIKIRNQTMRKDTSEKVLVKEPEEKKDVLKESLHDGENKIIKELQKKVFDLEKGLKVFVNTINIDSINKEFALVKELIDTKTNTLETHEIKQKLFDLNSSLEYVKDLIHQMNDDKKSTEDLTWMKKRVDAISAQLQSIKSVEDTNSNTNQSKALPFDPSRFVDAFAFNEFQKNLKKEIEGINIRCDEFKRLFEEVLLNLKLKITDKELKNLEDNMLVKLEEFKFACFSKLADKNNTNKNIKYLDTQIKHIMDVYIKKMEKGDNWLLAKKPLGGHSCASCESYIGELHEHNQYLPWNKINQKEIERSYRIGNGFSKMLQMISLENLAKHRDNSPEGSNLNQSLQSIGNKMKRIKSNRVKNTKDLPIESTNMSTIEYLKTEVEPEYDPNSPKVIKIYKKKMKRNEVLTTNPTGEQNLTQN